MNRIILFLAALAFGLGVALPHAWADTAAVVSACNASTFTAGETRPLQMTAGGVLCTVSSGGGGGSVTQGTSPWVVSGAAGAGLALETGGNLAAAKADLDSLAGLISAGKLLVNPGTVAVTGTFFQSTQPISAAALPLPTGAMGSTGGTVQPIAGTTGGCTPYHLAGGTAASTNSTSIKASAAGNLCDITPINTTTTIYYLKLYDSAAAPTCSSATGLKHVYPIPPTAAAGGAGGIVRSLALGESYASGIGFCVTGGGGDTDNTNAATGVYIEASYK